MSFKKKLLCFPNLQNTFVKEKRRGQMSKAILEYPFDMYAPSSWQIIQNSK